MKTEYQLRTAITDLANRQKDIEFGLKNPHKHPNDPEWVEFIANLKTEYLTNGERIGALESKLKMLKLEAL